MVVIYGQVTMTSNMSYIVNKWPVGMRVLIFTTIAYPVRGSNKHDKKYIVYIAIPARNYM